MVLVVISDTVLTLQYLAWAHSLRGEGFHPPLLNFLTIYPRVMNFYTNGNHHENYSILELGTRLFTNNIDQLIIMKSLMMF